MESKNLIYFSPPPDVPPPPGFAAAPVAPAPTAADPQADSVAAKLARIRAVVARGAPAEADAEPEPEEAEASVSAMLEALDPARDETPGSVQARRDILFTDTLASAAFDDAFDSIGGIVSNRAFVS